MPLTIDTDAEAKKLATIVYALQAVSFFVGLTAIAGAVLNTLKTETVKGTYVESHFRWQLRTFWFGLAGILIGAFTFWILIGYFILLGTSIWIIYRIIKGWLKLSEGQPV